VFNSFEQFHKFSNSPQFAAQGETIGNASFGIRVNPECSTQAHGIYDPCAPFSRLGVTLKNFPQKLPKNVDGLHFHTLCEQNADALEITLNAAEDKFGKHFAGLKWLNFGGGHHITKADYDIDLLVKLINRTRRRYGVEVYLEPGEAVALGAGTLRASVLALVNNGVDIAILDTSAACHMPDVLEMPYRPVLIGAGVAGEKAFTYRLGAHTCLAGDIIGDYSFDAPLKSGDVLEFCDMAIYTMVKNNTFNGISLPSIVLKTQTGELKTVKSFDYEDFKRRLG
jgi:carboxynorspermidine decarboxylase